MLVNVYKKEGGQKKSTKKKNHTNRAKLKNHSQKKEKNISNIKSVSFQNKEEICDEDAITIIPKINEIDLD